MYLSGIADEAGQRIETQIKAHKELGWKHIGLRNIDGVNVTDLCDEVFEAVAEKIMAADLQVSDFASGICHWARPVIVHPEVDICELRRAVPRMKKLRCRYIRTMGYCNAGWPERRWKNESIQRLSKLASIAAESGIVMVYENCAGWTQTGAKPTLELLESVGSEALKLLWDTANPVVSGLEPWDFYKSVKEHIAYVHIKDAVKETDGSIRYVMPGEGEGKVREIIADLLGSGYGSGISIEPHLGGMIHKDGEFFSAEDGYREYVQYGKKLMELIDSIKTEK